MAYLCYGLKLNQQTHTLSHLNILELHCMRLATVVLRCLATGSTTWAVATLCMHVMFISATSHLAELLSTQALCKPQEALQSRSQSRACAAS